MWTLHLTWLNSVCWEKVRDEQNRTNERKAKRSSSSWSWLAIPPARLDLSKRSILRHSEFPIFSSSRSVTSHHIPCRQVSQSEIRFNFSFSPVFQSARKCERSFGVVKSVRNRWPSENMAGNGSWNKWWRFFSASLENWKIINKKDFRGNGNIFSKVVNVLQECARKTVFKKSLRAHHKKFWVQQKSQGFPTVAAVPRFVTRLRRHQGTLRMLVGTLKSWMP